MDEEGAFWVMECLENTTMSFAFAEVKHASPIGSFTSLHDTIQYTDTYLEEIAAADLFNITENILMGETESEDETLAVDRLVHTLNDKTGRKSLHEGLKEKYESDQFWFISSHLLLPLSGECILSNDICKKLSIGGVPKDLFAHTGIGSKDTWHGKPDAICNIILNTGEYGATETPVEAKARNFSFSMLNQVVGQAVVASFIQRNTYPRMNSLVPAVGISGCGSMTAAMYDCKHDILLHFHKNTKCTCEYINKVTGQYYKEAVVLLWLLLHHQLFLKPLSGHQIWHKCNLKKIFRINRTLGAFNTLTNKKLGSWPMAKIPQLPI